MILAGFATQTPLQIVLGYLLVALFFLCFVLALHSLYVKIAKYFAAFLGSRQQTPQVNVTINEMYDSPAPAKKTGPPHPDIEGKV